MVKIKGPNGEITTIPNGAVSAYESLGFVVIREDSNDTHFENVDSDKHKSYEEKFIDEVVQKPLSEWSKKEITKFLKFKGKIDLLKNEDGTNKTVEEAKEIVAEIISSEE